MRLMNKYIRPYALLSVFCLFFAFNLASQSPDDLVSSKDQGGELSQDEQAVKENMRLYLEVMALVKNYYVSDEEINELFLKSINGMLVQLDPHSMLLTPSLRRELEDSTNGKFGGLGIHITMRDGLLTVISPIEGTPAFRKGVHAWDRIVQIDGVSTEKLSMMEAVGMLKGTPGTEVTITIVRARTPKPIEITIVRALIQVDAVYKKMIGNDVGYIRLSDFSESCEDEVKGAIKDLRKEGMKALILDLRNNPGGLLDQAVAVSDIFLPKNELVVYTLGRNVEAKREYYTQNSVFFDGPMVIMINSGSASASEIVTGALQDLKRAVVVGITGQRSFGKGSVQSVMPIDSLIRTKDVPDGGEGALKLTIAKYYTPKGRSIEDLKGLSPDVDVPVSLQDEIDLRLHGMLGEPSYIEPDNKDESEDENAEAKESVDAEEKDEKDSQKSVDKARDEFTRKVLRALNAQDDIVEKKEEDKVSDAQLDKALEVTDILMLANDEINSVK